VPQTDAECHPRLYTHSQKMYYYLVLFINLLKECLHCVSDPVTGLPCPVIVIEKWLLSKPAKSFFMQGQLSSIYLT